MTQSYEQSFDFSESEDEDEGMSTTSCSSREEDGSTVEGGESKVLPSVCIISLTCLLGLTCHS